MVNKYDDDDDDDDDILPVRLLRSSTHNGLYVMPLFLIYLLIY